MPPVDRSRETRKRVSRWAVWIALAALLVITGRASWGGRETPDSEPAPGVAASADYTVTAKTFYKGGSQNFGKFGYYVTVIIDGEELERSVSAPCYAAARVEAILAENCR